MPARIRMDDQYGLTDRQNRKIFFAGMIVFAVGTVLAAMFRDWLLAGISAMAGLVFAGIVWLIRRETLARVVVSSLWLVLGVFLGVRHPDPASTRQFLFFIGGEICTVLIILLVWSGPRARTQWTMARDQLLYLAWLVCFWGQQSS
jgi:hypothetical protein